MSRFINKHLEITFKFFSDKECKWLIDFHKKNYLRLSSDLNYTHNGTEVINISKMDHHRFKFIESRLSYHIKKEFDYMAYPNYFELVRWPTNSSQALHKDFEEHVYTSIIYLNNDFEGGQTVVAGKKIDPYPGRMVTFKGNLLEHKVLEVTKGVRYTIPVWYMVYDEPDY